MQTDPQTPASPSTAKTVLVVDDFASVRFYHAYLLRQAGFQCIEARDGLEAFEKLRQKHVDLIMLDLIMPKMGGEDFIRQIRSLPDHAAIPLLIITSESVEAKIRPIAGTGKIGFAMKPIVPNTLIESVRKLLP
jgi:two-component system, chemotaxis family, chemotaxis protein CheY